MNFVHCKALLLFLLFCSNHLKEIAGHTGSPGYMVGNHCSKWPEAVCPLTSLWWGQTCPKSSVSNRTQKLSLLLLLVQDTHSHCHQDLFLVASLHHGVSTLTPVIYSHSQRTDVGAQRVKLLLATPASYKNTHLNPRGSTFGPVLSECFWERSRSWP